MLWRKKTKIADASPQDSEHPDRPGAKNRPTPKRSAAEAANKRPLVPLDRKAAAQADRAARREALNATRQAQLTGDESRMPARDKGPVRRYIRDYVDARFSLGEVVLPAMLISLLLTLTQQYWAYTVVFFLVYGMLAMALADSWLMWRRLKAQLIAKFGAAAIPGGSMMYAVMRAFQIRRTRLPRPQVARREFPG